MPSDAQPPQRQETEGAGEEGTELELPDEPTQFANMDWENAGLGGEVTGVWGDATSTRSDASDNITPHMVEDKFAAAAAEGKEDR